MESYFTIDLPSFAEFKDRGSKFTAYAYPIATVEDFKQRLAEVKKEHPKAVHHCFAYRIGTDGNSFRVSDDGEPSGSAGRPILGQLDSRQLTNVAVIVLRYFGGTLLGVPGLINAYKTATALALQLIPTVEKPIELLYNIHCNYQELNDVMTIIKQYNCTVFNQEMSLFCSVDFGIAKNRLDQVLHKLSDMRGVELHQIP
ncbi:MAG: YigZ family protein [Chitinophagaceae bacterium]